MNPLDFLIIFGCFAVWAVVAARWRRGLPVVPWQPRRRAPWGTGDVLVLFVLQWVIAPALVLLVADHWFGVSRADFPPPVANAARTADHPLAQALKHGDRWAAVLGAVSAIVVAPITEELLFRLVLQGWLESLERRWRRRMPGLRRIAVGAVPVTTVALLFAAIHYRTAESPLPVSEVVFRLSVYVGGSLLTVVAGVCWLRYVAGATLGDFGVVPDRLASDVGLGLLGFFATTALVLSVNAAAQTWLPKNVVADPIPLFFLGLALGVLYYRTHRIAPAIVLHAAFNAIPVLAMISGHG